MKEFQKPVQTPQNLSAYKYQIIVANAGNNLIKPLLYNVPKTDEPVPIKQSEFFGTPVLDNFKILGGSYFDNDGNKIVYGEIDKLYFEDDTVLFNLNQQKNIVVTAIAGGGDGTVKEYISDGDYSITISGVICSKDNNYPLDEVSKLRDICKAKASISVVSSFLQLFSIHNLVITDYTLPRTEGNYNSQYYTLQCLSDEPLSIQLAD